jgi:hypothetical protein
MHRSSLSIALLPLLAGGTVLAQAPGAQAFSLVNGGFEDPACTGNTATISNYPTCYIPQSEVPGWKTTDSSGKIEIWRGGVGAPPLPLAYQGNQYAELNSFEIATLFQDVIGIPAGNLVGFELAHRGRNGVDVMELKITDLGTDGVLGGSGLAADTELFTRQFSDGNTAWGFYSQANIATTLGNPIRFSYSAISSAGGSATIGNFLDAAAFGVGVGVNTVPAPLPVLGAGVAFGFSRRLRRRIRSKA